MRFASSVTETMRSVGSPTSNTNLAAIVKGPIEQPDTAGGFAQPTVTGGALNTNSTVVNFQSLLSPSSATVTSVSSTATAQNALSANTSRRGASFYCESGTVHLRIGGVATTNLYTVKLTAGNLYEMPKPVNSALVSVIGVGVIKITEEV